MVMVIFIFDYQAKSIRLVTGLNKRSKLVVNLIETLVNVPVFQGLYEVVNIILMKLFTFQEEKDRYDYGYSFTKTRETVRGLDDEIRRLKHLLNMSNATTIVPDFSMTLGECLVYLAQLNRELVIVSWMAKREPTTTKSTFGGKVEYTVLNYDKEECQAKLEWLQTTIAQLQIAIDRTNLTNMIEIE